MKISKRYSSYIYEWILPKFYLNTPYGGQILACAFFADSSNFEFLANCLRNFTLPIGLQWES